MNSKCIPSLENSITLIRWCFTIVVYTICTLSHAKTDFSEVGKPVTQIYSMTEHGGDHQIWDIIQDDKGWIYGATNSGLVIWDGEQWSRYDTPTRGVVQSLAACQKNRIYLGGTNELGFFESDASGAISFISLLEEWDFESRQIGEVQTTICYKDDVLFASASGLYFYDGTNLSLIDIANKSIDKIFMVKDQIWAKFKQDTHISKIELTTETTLLEPVIKGLPENARLVDVIEKNKFTQTIVTARHGVYETNTQSSETSQVIVPLQSNATISSALLDRQGNLYLGTNSDGLFIYDQSYQAARHYQENDNIGMNAVYTLFQDYQDIIWLGGSPNIVTMQAPHLASVFKLGGQSDVTEAIEVLDGGLYVTGNGFFRLQASNKASGQASFTNLLSDNKFIYSAIIYKGHYLLTAPNSIYAAGLDESIVFEKVMDIERPISLYIDKSSNTLFLSSAEGLGIVDLKKTGQETENWQVRWIDGTQDLNDFMAIDDNGVVWMGSRTQELYRIENAQHESKQINIQKFTADSGLGRVNVLPFYTKDQVVIGTTNGLMRYDRASNPPLVFIEEFPEYFHTPENDIFRFIEDWHYTDGRRIWYQIGNDVGFVKKDYGQDWQNFPTALINYPYESYRDFQTTDEDTLWVSILSGRIFRLNIDYVSSPPKPGKLNIRGIIDTRTTEYISQESFTGQQLTFDQSNNSLRFTFALADNASWFDTEYRTRLIGSGDDSWGVWSRDTEVVFSQLSGSDYTLEIQAKDIWGQQVSLSMPFVVIPPWYLSYWAYFTYFLFFLLALYLSAQMGRKIKNRQLEAQNKYLEETVKIRTEEVSAKVEELRELQILKDRFFANVSHEFRTPLTLTIGPLQALLQENQNKLSTDVKQFAESALNNANKMLALVGQFLDINRLEAGKFPIRVSQYDAADLMRRVSERFASWAQQNNQTIECLDCEEIALAWFDQDQIDKCVSNLVSNAVKYSGPNSHIHLSILHKQDLLGLKVSDNGLGLSQQAKSKVFDRYYQDKASEKITQPGTGIGLALVKELVHLHHGSIDLEIELGKYCNFTLWLQKENVLFKPADIVEQFDLKGTQAKEPEVLPALLNKEEASLAEEQGQDKTTLLVVDDNAELRHFISLRLASNYRILQAKNGEEGALVASKELPDLIISDVMMPVLDGLEMTEKLKQNSATSGIPIILLTAKATKRETVEGFMTGADDYLVKPFDTSELVMRVDALIRSRKVIRHKFYLDQQEKKGIHSKSDSFEDSVTHHINMQLSSPDFNVEKLATLMFMSRYTLIRKCKKEMGMSPIELIKNVRIERACILLNGENKNISEVAYGLGFESLSYFSRSFKQHTGKTPSEYADT
ncbi:hybrid sensor histidine kinase/response regulator transcription factor [Glaciecola petra]|uniref:histidine kinase n=1 Tax=Glaciecola petra TaxID=3075602 RepID=A0ABU2ZQK0_9ALTE|nr:response regulator [Aestuariibacter sp. P117]MDT0594913.1 response regulator [Aestuariibacter sp. P117]